MSAILRETANGSSTASSAAATTGISATAEIASDRAPAGSAARARTTSVVVSEREIARLGVEAADVHVFDARTGVAIR